VNLENVSPVGQSNGTSPQSADPFPLNCEESKMSMFATRLGGPNDSPPLVDFDSQMLVNGRALEG